MLGLGLLVLFLVQFLAVLCGLSLMVFLARPEVPLSGRSIEPPQAKRKRWRKVREERSIHRFCRVVDPI
jgi:hypothetical protein